MKTQETTNYERIAEAIEYIQANYKSQPRLEEIAAAIHLSPFHFQKLFTEWAEVSPKKFLQYITVEHAKQLLKKNQSTLFDTAAETGLSGTGRLHDLFINIEVLHIFTLNWEKPEQVKLHLKGTDFQLKVWETLLKIPMGELTTYGSIAKQMSRPNASRAVGSAVGDNPVALLIPCHRVIQSGGILGQYHWGASRKTSIIGWEAARISQIIKSQ